MTVAAIVLAAGASRRMGQPKPLLPWGGRALLAWEIDELMRSSVDDIVVVTGAHADDVRRALGDGARHCVFNPRWSQGRATSLACGAEALLALSATRGAPETVVVQNVDQPTRHDIIDRMVEELRSTDAQAVQPSFRGEAGHPVVVAGSLLPELARASEQTLGMRGVLERHPAHRIEMDGEPVVRIDLDTPDLLDEARRLLGIEAES